MTTETTSEPPQGESLGWVAEWAEQTPFARLLGIRVDDLSGQTARLSLPCGRSPPPEMAPCKAVSPPRSSRPRRAPSPEPASVPVADRGMPPRWPCRTYLPPWRKDWSATPACYAKAKNSRMSRWR